MAEPGYIAVDSSAYLAQLVGGLVIVIAAIVGLSWLLRRLSGTGLGSSRQLIEVLAARSVGTRERLLLIQVGQEQVLIGVYPHGMCRLHRLRHSIDLSDIQPPPRSELKTVDFANLLKTAISVKKPREEPES